jgi:alkylated DNA repair dioxygenase AlkB
MLTTSLMQTPLFNDSLTDFGINLLSKDGQVNYFSEFLDEKESFDLFHQLMTTLDWQADQIFIFGKNRTTLRKVAWVGDAGCTYRYSGVIKIPQAWTPELLVIKEKIEQFLGATFNSCLLNLYHNGDEGMGWHSDDEKELAQNASIASISLGGERKFAFRHKRDIDKAALFLKNGSLLVMHPPTQEFWKHSLLKTRSNIGPRINLTFRKILLRHES